MVVLRFLAVLLLSLSELSVLEGEEPDVSEMKLGVLCPR